MARKCTFLSYAQGERGYWLWSLELNLPVISNEVTFDESPILLAMSDHGNIHKNLNGIQLKVELQSETPKVASTNEVINTNGTCSEVENVEPTVVVTANINKVCVRSLNNYGCNNDFALSLV